MSDDDVDRDTWTTPKWIADAVGDVDLDPCGNERSIIRAARTFDLARGQDGLKMARFVSRRVRTYVNPPYSHGSVMRWVRAYRHTRFTFLVRFDVSTEWWAELWKFVRVLATPIQRVAFDPPPGVAEIPGSPFPHALLYARAEDVTEEVRRICYVMNKDEVDRVIDLKGRS